MATKIIKTTKLEAPLPIEDLTEVILDGSGVFDKFLTLHRAVLDREFKQGRIVGKEYSDTFTRTYSANLEMAIQFLFSKEKQAYEIDLLEAQKAQIDKQNELADSQLAQQLYINEHHLPLQTEQLELQKCNLELDCQTKQYNLDYLLPKELELKDAQMRKMDADARIAEKDLELKEAMLPLTIQLTLAQIKKMEADAELSEKQLLLADKELELKDRELDLLERQIELTVQKVVTEKAQTDPSVIKDGSVISMNNKVLAAQVDGFKRDAEQKAANTLLQTWIVRLNNDAAKTNKANMLTDGFIGRAVETMMEGVGIDSTGRVETDI